MPSYYPFLIQEVLHSQVNIIDNGIGWKKAMCLLKNIRFDENQLIEMPISMFRFSYIDLKV